MTWELISWLLVIVLLLYSTGRAISCRNGYADKVISVGREAIYEPSNSLYWVNDIVKFRCPKGYHFEKLRWHSKEYVWIKCSESGWLDSWPTCRGPLENLTCHNRYEQSIKATPNWQYPRYTPNQSTYKTLSSVEFSCPRGMYFRGTKGLSHAVSKCKEDETWSREWPMCKGHTCEPLNLLNGIVDDKNRKLSPGTVMNIRCRWGYYLFGPNTSTCTQTLMWTGFPECVTIDQYKERCEYSNGVFFLDQETPRCVGGTSMTFTRQERGGRRYNVEIDQLEAIDHSDEELSKRITLSIAVPLSFMFLVLLAVSMVYVRRLRLRNSEMAQEVRYRHADQTIQLVLPSYKESIKSNPTTPPPTYEETFSFTNTSLDTTAEHGQNSSPVRYGSPPPRSPFRYGSPPPYGCYMDS